MGYKMFFVEEEGGIITEFSGNLTGEEIRKATKERYSDDSRIKKIKYVLNDYTNSTSVEVNSEDVKFSANIAVRASKLNKDVILAGVLPSNLIFGLGRMWQAYASESNWQIYPAKTREDAEKYIKEKLKLDLKFNK